MGDGRAKMDVHGLPVISDSFLELMNDAASFFKRKDLKYSNAIFQGSKDAGKAVE